MTGGDPVLGEGDHGTIVEDCQQHGQQGWEVPAHCTKSDQRQSQVTPKNKAEMRFCMIIGADKIFGRTHTVVCPRVMSMAVANGSVPITAQLIVSGRGKEVMGQFAHQS